MVPNLVGAKHLSRAASLVKGDSSVRAELVRRRIAELRRVSNEIAETKARLREALAGSGTTLTEVPGIGPLIAAKILGEVGDVDRIRSQAAFAMMAGTAPLVASSGMSSRHRLNRGGNRKLNFALHYMALVRYRSDEKTKAYVERRRAEGKTFKEAMRCLKRHLSNVVYRQMVSDWRAMQSV
jgi:transposase